MQQDTRKAQNTTNKGLEANGEGGQNMQITQTNRGWTLRSEQTLTVVAAPVYVDAAAIVAGKLSEGETRGVRWGQSSDWLVPKTVLAKYVQIG